MLLLLLGSSALVASRLPGFSDGDWAGLATRTWFWLVVANAVIHQLYVWFCWRIELYARGLTRVLGPAAFIDWLFGQATEAGIQPPTDLSLGSILQFVLDILGLSMDMIWERLALKIGEERVEQIKTAINFLTGAWEWISVALNDGPGALWEMIQSQISGLWTTIINAAMQWIMLKVIEKATIWLLGFLDPTFIMAVVNSLIIMYKAIESFVQYITEMLEIINTVLNGIGEIAAGAIAGAANYLENALAESLPIVIGFLANQFGLGKMGKKLAEIIETVREYVVKGIDWLIDKALAVGQGVLNTLGFGGGQGETTTAADGEDKPETPEEREAGQVVTEVPFDMNGTPHTLTLRIDENGKLEVFMASDYAERLSEALTGAIDQAEGRLEAELEAEGDTRLLEDLIERLQTIQGELALIIATPEPEFREHLQKRDEKIMQSITNELRYLAKKHLLDDLEIEFSRRWNKNQLRYLPNNFDVRERLYLTGSGYKTNRIAVLNRDLPRITTWAALAIEANNRADFDNLVDDGLLPEGSDIDTFDVNTIPYNADENPKPDETSTFIHYNVDHVVALASHWKETGFNTTDQIRWQAAANVSGLQAMTGSGNSSKGALNPATGARDEFQDKFYVGDEFRSAIADNNNPLALTIRGQPFLQSKGGAPWTEAAE